MQVFTSTMAKESCVLSLYEAVYYQFLSVSFCRKELNKMSYFFSEQIKLLSKSVCQ